MTARPGSIGRPDRISRALWAFFGALLALRLISIYTENINWDEWALFARVSDTLRTGVLEGGGRPGLATVILIPFVQECSDAVAVVRSARWLWTLFIVGYVAGFWVLVRQVLAPAEHARKGAALAVGLLVLVPAFLRWSVQVRADQPALALGIWGGVALLASRKRVSWALVAGVLTGLGFLFSQKVVYIAGLVGALAAGQLILRRELRLSREASRAALCILGGVSVLVGFDQLASRFTPTSTISGQVQGGLGAFEFYRVTLGYSQYIDMLPTLAPHLLLSALIVAAVFDRRRVTFRGEVQVALVVLCLCNVVIAFHAARFEYFWMTLGLFPAAAAGIALSAIEQMLPSQKARRVFVGTLWTLLISVSVPFAIGMLRDTQRVQRESLAFIDRNFGEQDLGFHPERALFCRLDPQPLPTYFSQHIFWEFLGPDSVARRESLVNEFRERPISFVVETYRLDQFPPPIRELLNSSYVPYHSAVMIPGFTFSGRSDADRFLDPIVPGTYRWLGNTDSGGAVEIEGRHLEQGDTITLDRRRYEARWSGSDTGFLVLAVTDPPNVSTQAFYAPIRVQSAQFGGVPHPVTAPR